MPLGAAKHYALYINGLFLLAGDNSYIIRNILSFVGFGGLAAMLSAAVPR